MNDKEYMTCPNHGDEIVRLHEVEDEDDAMECLRCDFVCPNFLKNPIAEIYNHSTGERYLKNVWTGERA